MRYGDRAFCNAEHCKNFKRCGRALTPEVEARAAAWWGESKGEPPIARFIEPEKLDCFKKNED